MWGKSLLDGAAMVTTFCSIQFVTEVDNQTIILYTNRLLGAADNIRPWHINVVPESPGESRLIEIIRLNILKKNEYAWKQSKIFFLLFWHDCLQEISIINFWQGPSKISEGKLQIWHIYFFYFEKIAWEKCQESKMQK